ncbi:MAG: nitrilase-related carbon-nitrogen hydrolase [bacterium]
MRAFAVSNRIRFADGASAQAFDAKMRALFDARLRGGDLVQPDVDDVASHLLGPDDPADPVRTARDLVVFTEDVGLILAFQGEKAAALRDPGLATLQAFLGLGVAWLPQTLLSLASFDGVSLNRALTLALTDALWRPFVDTFARLADDYDVYLVAATDVADAWLSTNPLDVALFGDPEHPERGDVYRPADANVWNQAVIFDPDGRIVDRTRKIYLTPPEEDPTLLDLAFGDLRDLRVVTTPVGKLGVLISKDAWMADVVDRIDQLGADVIVQPDANPGAWASYLENGDTVWYPENWKAGNWVHVQRFPSLRHNVTPMMTGNLFDFAFDGQGAIVSDATAQERPLGFVGSVPDVGFRAVGRWAIADPGARDPRLDVSERRRVLAERSRAMAPGSGSPLENAYGESVIWADLAIPVASRAEATAPATLPPATRVASSAAAQWNPSIAVSDDGVVHVAWIDFRGGNADVYAARSTDHGATFGSPVRVDDGGEARPDHQDDLWGARLAVGVTGRVHVA